MSEGFVDSLAHLSEDPLAGGGSSDEVGVLTIARWGEVQAARDRVLRAKQQAARERESKVLVMRVHESAERDVAKLLGISQPTVNRTFRATLGEILAELGGPPEGTVAVALSGPSLCLKCGSRARARRRSVRQKVAGRWVITPERQLGLCPVCLPQQNREKLVPAAAA